MAILDDFQVEVVDSSSGEPLTEYHRNISHYYMPTNNDTKVENYIEARTGKEFKIAIRIRPTFDFLGADGILICLRIDGNVFAQAKFFSQKTVRKYRRSNEPIIVSRMGFSGLKSGSPFHLLALVSEYAFELF